jgi:hypothetical protein
MVLFEVPAKPPPESLVFRFKYLDQIKDKEKKEERGVFLFDTQYEHEQD